MKRLILIVRFLLLLVISIVIKGEANNAQSDSGSTGKETYVSHVIIDARWGKEPGQFGIYKSDQGLRLGPFTFTISPQGDIYIIDPENARIQKFNSDGNLLSLIPLSISAEDICVDQSGNIYLYHTARVPKRILQSDAKGNLLKEYPIVWKDGSMGWGPVYCDKSGRLFLSYRSDSLKTQMVFQVGTTEMVFSPEQQRSTLQPAGICGLNANLPDWENYLHKVKDKTFSLNSKRNVQKKLTKELSISKEGLLGIDDEAVYNIAKDEKNPDVSVILKYNYDGDLLATYTLNWKEGECEAFQTEYLGVWTSKQVVFDQGNLYTYIHCKDGLKIIKWSPMEVR